MVLQKLWVWQNFRRISLVSQSRLFSGHEAGRRVFWFSILAELWTASWLRRFKKIKNFITAASCDAITALSPRVLDWNEVPIRMGAHGVVGLNITLENQNATEPLTHVASASAVRCEGVKSVLALFRRRSATAPVNIAHRNKAREYISFQFLNFNWLTSIRIESGKVLCIQK